MKTILYSLCVGPKSNPLSLLKRGHRWVIFRKKKGKESGLNISSKELGDFVSIAKAAMSDGA